MRSLIIIVVVLVLAGSRAWMRRHRRQTRPDTAHTYWGPVSSGVGLVAARDVRERVKSRIFIVGTLFILAVVAASIIIPTLNKSRISTQVVGVVGTLSAPYRSTAVSSAHSVGTKIRFVDEPTLARAQRDLRSGNIDFAIIDAQRIEVNKAVSASDSSTTAQTVGAVALGLGQDRAVAAAQLDPAQIAILQGIKPLPVKGLHAGTPAKPVRAVSLIGVILIFVMLSQYNTWILIGVMEEKSSRVIEVLLATLRPIQLLTGKVLGIGLVAFAQAALILAFALGLASAVGSNVLHGTGPIELASSLVWLVVGYAFYSWVYAAAGSMAERQDQVQTLAFPLSLPMIFGYVVALTSASSASVSLLVKVLAYLPPTAPFEMPVLVGRSDVTWWQFSASIVISLVATVGLARLASRIYRRAILRTGRRVKWREVLGHGAV
ncbi:MAG TPA: ABC transporter permease [Acidimicrobiales bacterium]|nr:ABC transporter permease [Acidimicrobiales bacterium]